MAMNLKIQLILYNLVLRQKIYNILTIWNKILLMINVRLV